MAGITYGVPVVNKLSKPPSMGLFCGRYDGAFFPCLALGPEIGSGCRWARAWDGIARYLAKLRFSEPLARAFFHSWLGVIAVRLFSHPLHADMDEEAKNQERPFESCGPARSVGRAWEDPAAVSGVALSPGPLRVRAETLQPNAFITWPFHALPQGLDRSARISGGRGGLLGKGAAGAGEQLVAEAARFG